MKNNFEERFEKLKAQASQVTPEIQQEIKNGNGLSFVVPTELVDLPSKGRYYPEGHPLKDKLSVEIREMTAKEEDILTNKSFIKKGVVIDKLVASIIVDKNLDPESLLVGDRIAVVIAARASAYGHVYKVNCFCQACGSKNIRAINLYDAAVTDADMLESEPTGEEPPKYQRLPGGSILFEAPKSGWLVECRLLTGRDEKTLVSYVEANRSKNPDYEISITEQLYTIVDSINGISDKTILAQALQSLPAFDAKFIRTEYQKLIPNIKLMCKFNCSSCQSEQESEVPFTEEFFWPK